MTFGRKTFMLLDLITDAPAELKAETTDEYVQGLRTDMESAYRHARQNTRATAERQKRYYDAKVKTTRFELKQLVWVYYPRNRKGRYPKWSSYYVGSCLVDRRINNVNYVVWRVPKAKPWVIHVDKMKLHEGEVPSYWREELRERTNPDTVTDDSEVQVATGELGTGRVPDLGDDAAVRDEPVGPEAVEKRPKRKARRTARYLD